MCEGTSRAIYTVEDVAGMLSDDSDDDNVDDIDEDLMDVEYICPGSDDEFGLTEEVVGDERDDDVSDVDDDNDGLEHLHSDNEVCKNNICKACMHTQTCTRTHTQTHKHTVWLTSHWNQTLLQLTYNRFPDQLVPRYLYLHQY